MAHRTGSASIISLAFAICRIINRYGASDLGARTSPEFVAAVTALKLACAVLKTTDDFFGQRDATAPYGPEDQQGI